MIVTVVAGDGTDMSYGLPVKFNREERSAQQIFGDRYDRWKWMLVGTW